MDEAVLQETLGLSLNVGTRGEAGWYDAYFHAMDYLQGLFPRAAW